MSAFAGGASARISPSASRSIVSWMESMQAKLVTACAAPLFSGAIVGFLLSAGFQPPFYGTLTGAAKEGAFGSALSSGPESAYSKAESAASFESVRGGGGTAYSLPEGGKVVMEGYVRLRVNSAGDVPRVAEGRRGLRTRSGTTLARCM